MKKIGPLRIQELNQRDPSSRLWTLLRIELPPRRSHPPIRHRRTHEWVYVLSGSARGKAAGKTMRLRPGTHFYIPPKTWHSFHAGNLGITVLSLFFPPLSWNALDVERSR